MQTLRIPASKSHTIRALFIASLSKGVSVLQHPLFSDDTRSCMEACKAFGARFLEATPEQCVIQGIGLPAPAPGTCMDMQNSGTSLFFATAVAALAPTPVAFTGDRQLQRRSAAPLLKALADLGASVQPSPETAPGGGLPYSVSGPLVGGEATLECPTSQYLSALLLIAPLLPNPTRLHVPLLNEFPYIQMTLHWLKPQGVRIVSRNNRKEWQINPLSPGKYATYSPILTAVTADFSSAAFFLAWAVLMNEPLFLEGPDMDDPQGDKAVVHHLIRMGACIESCSEPTVGLKVIPRPLPFECRALTLDLNDTPDALPILAVVGAFCNGTTRLTHVAHARGKETDRIACMCTELRKCGFAVTEAPDGLSIVGQPNRLKRNQSPARKNTAEKAPLAVDGYGDHRMVMALSVLSAVGDTPLAVSTPEAAAVTFPEFFNLLQKVSRGIHDRSS